MRSIFGTGAKYLTVFGNGGLMGGREWVAVDTTAVELVDWRFAVEKTGFWLEDIKRVRN